MHARRLHHRLRPPQSRRAHNRPPCTRARPPMCATPLQPSWSLPAHVHEALSLKQLSILVFKQLSPTVGEQGGTKSVKIQ
jgi:hypothetical protein